MWNDPVKQMPGGALKTQDKQLVTSVSVLDPVNPDKYKFLFTKSIHMANIGKSLIWGSH